MQNIAIVGGSPTDLQAVDNVIMKLADDAQFYLFNVVCNSAAKSHPTLSEAWAEFRGAPKIYVNFASPQELMKKVDYIFFVSHGEQWIKNMLMQYRMMGKHGTVINL